MSLWSSLGIIWALAALLMCAGWIWQRRHANAGIVDVLWSLGLALAAVGLALRGSGAGAVRLLVGVLGTAWGLRLAFHLWGRVRAEEDGRYQALRAAWQGSQWKFFAFFQLQALLVALFALPFWAAAASPRPRTVWLVVAVLVWGLAIGGETLADRQLARFRAQPGSRARVCDQGLWRYSRHPNYFFEWVHWFTYVALAAAGSYRWLALSGPVLMYLFLRWLSGIPFTEAQALRTRGAAYREYQRRTPRLFPWFPKEST
jgi:steroid 5-alpha reductase family enzyme